MALAALTRCAAWIGDAYAGDSCTGTRPDGAIPNGIFLYFELTMLNPGGYWRAHFSADEQGLLQFHIFLGAMYLMLAFAYVSATLDALGRTAGMRPHSRTTCRLLPVVSSDSRGQWESHSPSSRLSR